jgi:phosphoribosylformimino-5-aminoimidazole carboxamide ribotide isomerase
MNVEATVALAQAVTTPVIASGGITSLADLAVLKTVAANGIEGAISGRALYDGRLSPRDALTLLAS